VRGGYLSGRAPTLTVRPEDRQYDKFEEFGVSQQGPWELGCDVEACSGTSRSGSGLDKEAFIRACREGGTAIEEALRELDRTFFTILYRDGLRTLRLVSSPLPFPCEFMTRWSQSLYREFRKATSWRFCSSVKFIAKR
jgi:hypothetical protein